MLHLQARQWAVVAAAAAAALGWMGSALVRLFSRRAAVRRATAAEKEQP